MGGTGADLAVGDSVRGMRATLAGATSRANGAFLNYDGSAIDW